MGRFLFICMGLALLPVKFIYAAPINCSKVIISAHPNYPPFHWNSEDTLIGASIEISRRIFESLGVDVKVSYEGPWKRVLMSAKQGKVDFIPALKRTSERQGYLHFTQNSFSSNPIAVFVRKNEVKAVTLLQDLDGLFGSVNAGDKHGEKIDSFISNQSNMQFIHGLKQNFQMLKRGRTDYFITGYYTGYDYLKANELDKYFEIAFKINELEIHNGFSSHYAKECNSIVNEFDLKLIQLKQEGEVEKSISKYHEHWLAKSDK